MLNPGTGLGNTYVVLKAESLQLRLEFTTSLTVKVSSEAYACDGLLAVEELPSPKLHAYDIVPVLILVRLVKAKLFPLKHCCESFMLKSAIGFGNT